MERRQFVKESIGLGFSTEDVYELTKLAFEDAKDKDIELDIKQAASMEEPKPEVAKKEKQDGIATIHSVIMAGLRAGESNAVIIPRLVQEFPDVDVKKLKQRMYEYRNHFNKGKIK